MSKYHAVKTAIGGRIFDSRLEARRYQELLYLVKAGEVRDIECQPRFLLQEAFKKNGKTYRKIEYVADFRVTYKDGHVEIEDCKGIKTEAFKLKAKLFERLYAGMTIKIP